MMRSTFALLVIGSFTLHASPIAGGSCGATGTLAEFVALGDAGCYLFHGERIFDISASLPASSDLSTFSFAAADPTLWNPAWSEAGAHSFPVGSVLTVHWDAPRTVVRAEWYQFELLPDLTFGAPTFHPLPLTRTGTITMTATIADAYLGFQIETLPAPPIDPGPPGPPPISDNDGNIGEAPEPSAFLPLLAGLALLALRRTSVNQPPS